MQRLVESRLDGGRGDPVSRPATGIPASPQ
jgi:hypothetical protein